MARSPQKTCPNLYRLIDGIEAPQLAEFLNQEEFRRQAWLDKYRTDPADQGGIGKLNEILHEKKPRLEPLEREAARVLSVAEGRGQYGLEGLSRTKLRPDELLHLKSQKDELARSLWAYTNHRMLFEAVESVLHLHLYRRYGRHYQSFQADAAVPNGQRSSEALKQMIDEIESRLDLGDGCSIERFDVPADGEQPASEMYIIYHPNPLTSAREVLEDGERRTIYYRPPGEATVIFTPSTGAIEVRADTRIIRRQVAESFAETILLQDLSDKPLDFREYDLSRFFDHFSLDCPEVHGFAVRRARVIRAEVSVGHLGNRLAISTTIEEDIDSLINRQPGLRAIFERAVAIRFIEIAVRYVCSGETTEKTLDFTISDQNSCSLLSLPDERERVLGHRLLRHWEILHELRELQGYEERNVLPILLELWDAGSLEVPGSWLQERGIDDVLLTSTGFLEPVGWEDVDLIADDETGMADARIIASDGRSVLQVSEGHESFAGGPSRYRKFRVNQNWLVEYLRSGLSDALQHPFIEQLSSNLIALGRLDVDGTLVPIYLTRRLDDPDVLADCDNLLRGRGDQGIGLALSAQKSVFRCIAANVLTPLGDHLSAGDVGGMLNSETLRAVFRNNRHLARGGQSVELVWDGGETGELFVPGRGSIQISGKSRLSVIVTLVRAYKSGSKAVKTANLNKDQGGMALRNIFGPTLWNRLNGQFIRSPGHGLWEIAA